VTADDIAEPEELARIDIERARRGLRWDLLLDGSFFKPAPRRLPFWV
jgi:hypothetical protein